ncbi:hypothetical protein [Paractinoplanes rishiriensis]|uniref:Uncharacterized protein n=1 Tax=Paractinoplanes rishiriensis TaxID=1050105 RepID=A0A919K0E0_9ACTN|nr:hypothetical protein [Actinoplanes rishiriensis]GIE98280.1 hypothetical protein Ari01nite_57450 [Actinoplanes rishiriensis]
MDRLDQVLATAGPLLRRVDDVLATTGAPAAHEVWGELRRVRLLPGAAAEAVAALRPAAFHEVVPELRANARACVETAADLPEPGEWSGEAAEAYEDVRRRAVADLSGGDESLDERLEATADLAEALTDWMAATRADLAEVLAAVLVSGQALTLTAPAHAALPPATAETAAAADVAVHVLRSIADNYLEAADLLRGSRDLA